MVEADRQWSVVQLMEGPKNFIPEEGGEGISANLLIDPLAFLLLNKVRDKIVRLASESLDGYINLCTNTAEAFRESASPIEMIGHAIEHRTVFYAAQRVITRGDINIIARGETTFFPRGVAIAVSINSNKGRGFNLVSCLLKSMGEMEALLKI